MINLCFLNGKVINEIDLKFIYDRRKKTLSKKNTSIVKIKLELLDGQVIELYAYNDMADYVFRTVKKCDYITIQGKLRNNYVEVEQIK